MTRQAVTPPSPQAKGQEKGAANESSWSPIQPRSDEGVSHHQYRSTTFVVERDSRLLAREPDQEHADHREHRAVARPGRVAEHETARRPAHDVESLQDPQPAHHDRRDPDD